ncbi:dynein axonemal intermediate chain 3-like [Athalia rosae]|uniref:dynein axonemal intermediate chain 3-like n=1 Tax=Athalia rosae TaxID=37344 RepID=UPI002034A364|nr:dynein axonemal intermediate chain 3-like [Athalia rosae]
MAKKVAKKTLNWSHSADDVEGVVRLELSPESQEILGCRIMRDVYLEYPWAYVPRDEVIGLLRLDDSQLIPFKDEIGKYEGDSFLIGYASDELVSSEFVICVTEEARNEVARRNGEVAKFLNRKVNGMYLKTPKPWVSRGSEFEVGENVTLRKRPLFEVEITAPLGLLGNPRNLDDRNSTDCKDGFMEIVPRHEKFDLVPMSRLTTGVQTNLPGRETGVQTSFGFPKNAWVRYGYEPPPPDAPEVIPDEKDEEDVEEEPSKEPEKDKEGESSRVEDPGGESGVPAEGPDGEAEPEEIAAPDPLRQFMVKYADDMIDVIDYNAAMNLHVHDIDELVLKGRDTEPSENLVFAELLSFVDLTFTAGKTIADLSWHPKLTGVAVVCYSETPNCDLVQGPSELRNAERLEENKSVVLIWSFTDSMSPVIQLKHDRPVSAVSFCPFRPDILVGGCETGQIVLWDFAGRLTKCSLENCCAREPDASVANNEPSDETNRAVLRTVNFAAVSNDFQSHHGTVREIRWLPPDHRVEPDGRLTPLSDDSNLQFLTAGEDGCVAVWDLSWEPRATSSSAVERGASRHPRILQEIYGSPVSELKKLDGLFKPIYSIFVHVAKEARNLPLLSLFVQAPVAKWKEVANPHETGDRLLGFRDNGAIRFETKIYDSTFSKCEGGESLRKFWAGTSEGDFIACEWEGHEFTEVSSSENGKCMGWSRVHDGPVTVISQSPHLPEVLLTVGGRFFAVWKDDFLESPLVLGKCGNSYTACCWTSRPGVFLVARSNGDLETWDLLRSTNECLAVQSVSGKRITGLFPHVLPGRSKVFAVCDHNGALRVFEEPVDFSRDESARIERFGEFVAREVRRKREFASWESNYLKTDEHCLKRKAARAADEAKRRHEEARAKFQREQEELARLEEERIAKSVKKSKAQKWREADLDRMRSILLAKKGYQPRELEVTRGPLVRQDEERSEKLRKAEERAKGLEICFEDALSLDLPNLTDQTSSSESTSATVVPAPAELRSGDPESIEVETNKWETIREEARELMRKNVRVREFDPEKLTGDARRRRKALDAACRKRSRKEERLAKLKKGNDNSEIAETTIEN